jgi:hypothetical protein
MRLHGFYKTATIFVLVGIAANLIINRIILGIIDPFQDFINIFAFTIATILFVILGYVADKRKAMKK